MNKLMYGKFDKQNKGEKWMKRQTPKSNVVTLVGKIIGDKEFSHEIYGEGFYKIFLQIPRLSDIYDSLPLTISERLLYDFDIEEEATVSIEGQLRSYNKSDYIPCIAWGRNARFVAKLNVGDRIKIWGRTQSRTYQKKIAGWRCVRKSSV